MLTDTAQKIADAFGLVNSPMLIQLITDGKRVFVLEFSARTGGGVKYILIKRSSGFDVISAVVDLTLGKTPHLESDKPKSKYVVNEFIYCHDGIFDKLVGFDEAKQSGTISDYYLFKPSGTKFDGIASSGDRVAGYTIVADSCEELGIKHAKALSMLEVHDQNGNDMFRKDIIKPL